MISNENAWDAVNLHGFQYLSPTESQIAKLIFPAETSTILQRLSDENIILQPCCNNGRELLNFGAKGARCYGFDFSKIAISYAEKFSRTLHLDTKCEFFHFDVNEDFSTLEIAKVDIVYCSLGTLMWVRDTQLFMQRCKAMLKNGGFVVIWDFHPDLLFEKVQSARRFEHTGKRFVSNLSSYLERTTLAESDAIVEPSKSTPKVEYYGYDTSAIHDQAMATGLQLRAHHTYNFVLGEAWDDRFVEHETSKFVDPSAPERLCSFLSIFTLE
jgi:SAM-dependent methyltransferase